MPTLLQINTCLHIGGTGGIAENIGKLVIENGWNSYIAYSRNMITNAPQQELSSSKLIKIGNKCDFILHVLKTRLLDQHGLGSKRATRQLIKTIDSIHPDIIHLHNIHGYYLNYPILFEYLSQIDIPIIWTLHDCWALTGHCSHFEMIGCEKWKTTCDNCPNTNQYPKSWFHDNSCDNFHKKGYYFNLVKNLHVVTVSHWLKDIAKKSLLKNCHLHVIYNGIDLNTFCPITDIECVKKKYKVHNKFIILGVSVFWTQKKGFDDFIKLSAILDERYVIILVGVDEKQKRILPDNIIGINRTSNINELVELYSISDVFCNLTYEDSFPTTNLEALACGTPVITYKTGGCAESIDDETGYAVEKGNIQMVAKYITRINDKMDLKCRNRATSEFDKKNNFSKYLDLYKSLIKE